ncbi:MAG: orotate phosphoribosyltransferase [Deltaproteobacteria bacterium]|nr:orotate phosphoribosyltransferase [Deltaproteobacteria bacterium]
MPDLEDMKTRLAGILLEKSYIEGEFILTSGQKSDYYFDCKQTALHPEGSFLIGSILLDLALGFPGLEGVGGMTLGADPLVSAVTLLSHIRNTPLPGFIVRKQSKGHGTNQFLEGMANFGQGMKVCLLEDVVTTGGTLLTACQRVEDAGLSIVGILCVLDREQGGDARLKEHGYELRSIFTRRELLARGR